METTKAKQIALPNNSSWEELGFQNTRKKQMAVLRCVGTGVFAAIYGDKSIFLYAPPVGVKDPGGGKKKHFKCSPKDKYGWVMYWFVPVLKGKVRFVLYVGNADDRIDVVEAPDPARHEELLKFVEWCEEEKGKQELLAITFLRVGPPPNDEKNKALDVLPGKYTCDRFTQKKFRSVQRTILSPQPIGKNDEPAADRYFPTNK